MLVMLIRKSQTTRQTLLKKSWPTNVVIDIVFSFWPQSKR